MKKIVSSILFLFVLQLTNAQRAQSVFFELGGASVAGFNYDTRFGNKQDGLGGRVGVGGVMIDGDGATFFPLGINYLVGKDGKNYFELGGGVTLIKSSDNSGDLLTTTFGTLNFGYRYQPKANGVLFRVNISPIIANETFFPFYGGISLGYKF